MQTIYTAFTEIKSGPLRLRRTFRFATERERDAFLDAANESAFMDITGHGIDHLMTCDEAIAECKHEQAEVG